MKKLPLHSAFAPLGARFGEWADHEVPLDFGHPDGEYRAGQGGLALLDASYRDLVRVTGEDRVSFLHGMVTNDIKGLPPGGVAYAALLTPKGAMVSDARILRRGQDLLLDLEPGQGPKVLEFLNRYLISEDAELQDVSEEWGRLALLGPKAAGFFAAAFGGPAPGDSHELPWEGAPLIAVAGHLSPAVPGIDLWVPRPVLEPVLRRLLERGGTELVPVGMTAVEQLRVEAGLPRYGADMDDHTIPLEANLQRALHYNKGCYIGQEVIARATFRGHMNRKLTGVLLGSAAPAPRTELKAQEKKAGWVTTVVHSPAAGQQLGLAYVHRDFLAPGTQLELATGEGKAVVVSLPWGAPAAEVPPP